jgi:glycosyltransferase involved in cell wall biosynthesis
MKFSVLIAAYRAGKYIGKALESVRAQTHTDWEVVVVEDGSRDETESIVRAFASSVAQSVRYDNLGQNRGVATARTRLVELAAGEALAFIDADDWWTPTHLERAQIAFDRGADVAVSRIQLFDLDSARPMESYAPAAAFFLRPVEELFRTSHIMTSSCVALRTSLARKVGPFDAAFRIGEDRDYWLRCAFQGARFADTGEITCFYAKHATSTMARTLVWSQQEVAFYEKYLGHASLPLGLRKRSLSHVTVNYGRLLRSIDPKASFAALARAWKLTPLNVNVIPQLFLSGSAAILRKTKS